MLTKELLLQHKDRLEDLLKSISLDDLELLVEWLKEKDDTLRYAAFQLLVLASAKDDSVYSYWETFAGMLQDENSYQRSLGLMLISENIRWDSSNKFQAICSEYLKHCDDEKFITSRQCIQGLNKIVKHSDRYNAHITDMLLGIDLNKRKDSQKGLLLLDIVEALGQIYLKQPEERVEAYLKAGYGSGNEKVKKAVKSILKGNLA